MREKRITLQDVANECNCSKSAVSKALNGNKDISDELKSKIHKAIKTLGYKPRSNNWEFSYPYRQRRLLIGLGYDFLDGKATSRQLHYFITLIHEASKKNISSEIMSIELILQPSYELLQIINEYDGIILIGGYTTSSGAGYGYFLSAKKPWISLGYQQFRECAYIDTDHAKGMRMILEDLIQGTLPIGYLTLEHPTPITTILDNTYTNFLVESGNTEKINMHKTLDPIGAIEIAVKSMLDTSPAPKVIICATEELAIAAEVYYPDICGLVAPIYSCA